MYFQKVASKKTKKIIFLLDTLKIAYENNRIRIRIGSISQNRDPRIRIRIRARTKISLILSTALYRLLFCVKTGPKLKNYPCDRFPGFNASPQIPCATAAGTSATPSWTTHSRSSKPRRSGVAR